MISYDSLRGGVSVITEKGDITTSFLLIQNADLADSGRYSCSPSNAEAVEIRVHVLNGNVIDFAYTLSFSLSLIDIMCLYTKSQVAGMDHFSASPLLIIVRNISLIIGLLFWWQWWNWWKKFKGNASGRIIFFFFLIIPFSPSLSISLTLFFYPLNLRFQSFSFSCKRDNFATLYIHLFSKHSLSFL